MNPVWILLANKQRLAAVPGFQYLIALAGQQLRSEVTNGFFILDQQNGLCAPKRLNRMTRIFVRIAPLVRLRKIYFNRATLADFAAHRDMPTALFYYSVNRRQSQPGAFALAFGSKKRLEYLRHGIRVHARSGVRYPQHYIVVV